MRRYVPLLIAGSALIAAACRDSVAPTRSTTAADLVTLQSFGGGPSSFASLWSSSNESDAKTVTFTIKPEGGTARIGDFRLEYPANSVCDPATSSYGPSEWLTPCETLNTSITITAKFWYVNGNAYSDFAPNIRFAPDKNVVLYVVRPKAKGNSLTAFLEYSMWYTTVVGDTRFYVDEAYFDSSLATHVDSNTGKVSRKIRHFSGYYVRTGEACDDTAGDPDCVGGGMLDSFQ
jgi:hypothetical protein